MAKLIIQGGRPLNGVVRVSGRKNSAVAVLPAALLADSPSTLENLPEIEDVRVFVAILEALGARASREGNGQVRVDPARLAPVSPPYELVKRLRASYYLLGVLLARFGRAEVSMPGGCDIGLRPIDQHLKGLAALGAEVSIEHGMIKARAPKLAGASIYLDVTSVGATVNLMLAASLA
ncbi:MAG: UDP-N-acetylglucosamine 1-carboxyvinyltransferase, partial [Acetobacteraceae bacterium]|nr:UDP-N-acetylglucosamine 1-carboxyvinyltransferase [Acetobacteraceae bacterium]